MNKQNKNDNAANRKSYVGYIYNVGEDSIKSKVLNSIYCEWSDLHRRGYIHIHDLDAYGLTYNCLTFDIVNSFPFSRFNNFNEVTKIVNVFEFVEELLSRMGNEQSGGMSFANFDIDFAYIFSKLNVSFKGHEDVFKASIMSLVLWCNNTHTRMGQTSYYVTFNVGLGTSDFSRFLTSTLLDCFMEAGNLVYKPNIVFKVHKGVNRFKSDKNFDLLCKSLRCTSWKMIPTYLLCDCECDKDIDPYNLSIMGCRTRVVDDLYGEKTAIGRGNITNISINLPRLAFDVIKETSDSEKSINLFKKKWISIAEVTKDILIDRYQKTIKQDINLFPTNQEYKLWCQDINRNGLEGAFCHGTLSIGFIGLSETIEILTNKKFWKDESAYNLTLDILSFMRNYTDSLTKKYKLNFSLLATSGELISGRFIEFDKKIYSHNVLEKDFYTNSFHIDVDSKLPAYKKIQLEGPFHKFTNGGCITYVELGEAPIENVEGLDEMIEVAIESGVHYLGFNFPKDICNDCGASGTFDICPSCGSKNITRIRRVSGYLEIEDYFTSGKKNESKRRLKN